MKKHLTLLFVFLSAFMFQIQGQKDSGSEMEKTPRYTPPPPPPSMPSTKNTVKVKSSSDVKFSCSEEYSKVWDLYKSEDYEKSLSLIDKVLKHCRSDAAYFEMKGFILIKMDRKKDIIKTTTEGLAISPTNASLFEMRGNTYYFDFQPENALADFRQMLKYDKQNARYYNNYLKLLNEMRKDSEMISVFSTFSEEKKNGADFKDKNFIGEIYFYTSLAYQRQKNTKRAVDLLDEALKLAPDAKSYLNNRALFLQELEQYDKALIDMNKLIEIDPKITQSYIHRASIFQDLKQFENARKDYLKALALGTSDNMVYADLANVYLLMDDYENARRNFEIFLTKNEQNPSAYSNYAYALFDMKDYTKSLENFEKAYKLEDNEIDTLIGLAVLYKLTGNAQKSDEIKKEIGIKTEYKADKKLLKTLENSHYFYSDKLKKEWQNLF